MHAYLFQFVFQYVMLLNVKMDKTLMIYNSQFILFAQRFDLINDDPFQVNEFVHEEYFF